MKTLLIVPPDVSAIEPFSSSPGIKGQLKFIKGFPLGLGYIAAVLEKHNIEVEILDAQVKGLGIEDIIKYIEKSSPKIIGITTLTANIKTAVEIARRVRLADKGRITVFGGPHAMYDYENLLNHYAVDFIVYGEGEFIFLNLLKALESGSPPAQVKGVIYNENGSIRWNKGEIFVDDLDRLPFPARGLTDFNAYLKHFTHNLSCAAQILTSRGCPYKCAFCSSGNTFYKWRGRSPKNIIAEMKDIIDKFPGVKSFSFMDDNFTLDHQRVFEICRLIIRTGLNKYPWDCLSRCANLNEDLLLLMKEAGCIRIHYGIESGSTQILENISKRIDLGEAKRVMALTKKSGIEAYAFFMVGNPGESDASIKKTVEYAVSLKPTYMNWFVTQVYPGTRLAELQPQRDWVKYVYEPEIKNPSIYTHPCVPVFSPEGFDREMLKREVAGIMRLFFWLYLPRNFRKWISKFFRHPLYSLWYIKNILFQ